MSQETSASPERFRLSVLYFLLAHALGLWSINFSSVLKAHGYEHLIQWCGPAGVLNALSAMISPLAVGALADQRFSSEKVLRWLGLCCMMTLGSLFWAIDHLLSWPWVLCIAGCNSLCSVPTFVLATSLVVSRLNDSKKEFGPVRAWATIGWMCSGLVVSYVLNADQSTRSGYSAVLAWALCLLVTFSLRSMPPPALQEKRSWKAVMGFEAWSLLKDPDHRVVFIGAGFLNAPLVAYMQHTHPHLEELAVRNSTAFMSLGQVMEVVGLFGLAWLVTQFRMKWLFLVGIAIAVLRFALFSQNTVWGMGLGIFLHGICFTLFYMTAQIYLDERISPTMRSRAQALLTLMMSGVGNMAGALGCAWWLSQCVSAAGKTDWPRYWGGLCVVSVLILAWFALQYQGKKSDGTVK